jgi:hypothetical protein
MFIFFVILLMCAREFLARLQVCERLKSLCYYGNFESVVQVKTFLKENNVRQI